MRHCTVPDLMLLFLGANSTVNPVGFTFPFTGKDEPAESSVSQQTFILILVLNASTFQDNRGSPAPDTSV